MACFEFLVAKDRQDKDANKEQLSVYIKILNTTLQQQEAQNLSTNVACVKKLLEALKVIEQRNQEVGVTNRQDNGNNVLDDDTQLGVDTSELIAELLNPAGEIPSSTRMCIF